MCLGPNLFNYPARGFAPLPFARSIAAGQAQSICVKDRESGEVLWAQARNQTGGAAAARNRALAHVRKSCDPTALGNDYFESLGLPQIYAPAPA